MAVREIIKDPDPILYKKCHAVTKFDRKLASILEDMAQTMLAANGVGLAGPQVGILKRIVTIDTGEGALVMINPKIIESSGSQTGEEGCLSLPGKSGVVTRPSHVKARAFDEEMQEYEIEADDLLARAICHELDHLDGHMYTELVEGELHDVQYTEE